MYTYKKVTQKNRTWLPSSPGYIPPLHTVLLTCIIILWRLTTWEGFRLCVSRGFCYVEPVNHIWLPNDFFNSRERKLLALFKCLRGKFYVFILRAWKRKIHEIEMFPIKTEQFWSLVEVHNTTYALFFFSFLLFCVLSCQPVATQHHLILWARLWCGCDANQTLVKTWD